MKSDSLMDSIPDDDDICEVLYWARKLNLIIVIRGTDVSPIVMFYSKRMIMLFGKVRVTRGKQIGGIELREMIRKARVRGEIE